MQQALKIMANLPTQTSQNSRPKQIRQSMDSSVKIGTERLSASRRNQLLKSYYSKKILLQVPEDILEANPDKHFVFINLNQLEKQGYYHPQGYKIYKTEVDSGSMKDSKFDSRIDGMVHRNEMVLAYLTKEEFEERELERQVAREAYQLTDVITNRDGLQGFNPVAKHTKEIIQAQ